MTKTNMEDDIYLSLTFKTKSTESIKFIESLFELIRKEGIKSHKSNMLKALPCIAVGLLRARAVFDRSESVWDSLRARFLIQNPCW